MDDTTSTPAPALRELRTTDAPAVLAAFASAADMARQGTVTTTEEAEQMVRWLMTPPRRTTAVLAPGTEELVGIVGVSIDEENRSGWFFYWLHAAWRGRRLTSRAAAAVAHRALLPAADGGWGLERLELGYRANNPASAAVARAAGFVHEGTERGKFLLDGERLDVHTAGRLRSDPAPIGPAPTWLD